MNKTTLTLAFAAALTTAGIAQAANPFALDRLDGGYQLASADTKAKEGKCGEGKCGGAKPKAKEGKCGEGKCGGKK